MFLLEGGNVFKLADGQSATTRISRENVVPTVQWLEQLTGLSLVDNMLGSTGRKETSGDLDLGIDASKISKEVLTQQLLKKGIKAEDIRKSGDSVHLKTPILGDAVNGYVQTDFMFGDPEFQKFALNVGDSDFKGVHRAILLASIAKAQGLKWSYKNGLVDRDTNEIISKNPVEIAQRLIGGTVADLSSDCGLSRHGSERIMTLRVRGLTIDHGAIRAISNATFNVPRGSITAIIGANGAGKSTLLRTISGLKRATTGSILWDEISLEHLQTEQIVRRGIIHVPEGRSVVTELTVHENLMLGGVWRLRAQKEDVAAAIEEVYQLFPRLNERKKQRADTLSGGERQMLAIGRGLIARPQLLLLDEPSLGLAPLVVEQIFHTLSELQGKTGMTILLVEQNAMSALRIASQGIVLDQGRVVIADNARAIMNDTALRHAYLGY